MHSAPVSPRHELAHAGQHNVEGQGPRSLIFCKYLLFVNICWTIYPNLNPDLTNFPNQECGVMPV